MLAIQTKNTRRIVGFISLAAFVLLIALRGYMTAPMALALSLAWLVLVSFWTHAYWRDIGEIARDGQKTAWLWGGINGFIIAVFLLVIPPVRPLIDTFIGFFAFPTNAIDPVFVAGIMWAFAAQMIGFTIYWLCWWIAKR